MTTFAEIFEEETRRKVGHAHELAMPEREPTYGDFADLFPPTTEGRVEAARAAGYGGPGEHRQGSKPWTRRRSFMRQLQRWTTGGAEKRRPPEKLRAREAGIVRSAWKKSATPRTVRGVLRLVWRWGATVPKLVAAFDYEPERMRELTRFAVGIRPSVLRRSGFTRELVDARELDWEALGDAFLLAFGRAYGMGDFLAGGSDDVEDFSYRVGFTEGAQYGFGVASRPPKAKRATGNKYRGVA